LIKKKLFYLLFLIGVVITCPPIIESYTFNSPTNSDLALDLPLNEGSGIIVYDYSGHNRDGVIFGATWYEDALFFDGQNDYITLGDLFGTVISNPTGHKLTWMFDVFVLNKDGGYGYIIGAGAGSDSCGFSAAVDYSYNYLYIGYKAEDGKTTTHTPDLEDAYTLDYTNYMVGWHTITATYNGDALIENRDLRVYIDGVLRTTVKTLSRTISDSYSVAYFGRPSEGGYYHFNGYLRNVKVFSKILDPSTTSQSSTISSQNQTSNPQITPLHLDLIFLGLMIVYRKSRR
jgi:hypothetical protein